MGGCCMQTFVEFNQSMKVDSMKATDTQGYTNICFIGYIVVKDKLIIMKELKDSDTNLVSAR